MYALAFCAATREQCQNEAKRYRRKASGEDIMLAMQADTEAFSGRLRTAREFSRRAVESAQKAELAEPAAFGRLAGFARAASEQRRGRKDADEVLRIAPNSAMRQTLAALILARTGEMQRAQTISTI